MLLFLLLVTCNEHTSVYQTFGGPDNVDNRYFVAETYSAGVPECQTFADNSQFRNKVKANYVCSGRWCRADGWTCGQGNKQCYEVEHIIPKANTIPGLAECNANIYGNVVMAYGMWNLQCSNGKLCEKGEIYGDIYRRALDAMYRCCGREPPSIPPGAPPSPDINPNIISFIVVSVVVLVAGLAYCIGYRTETCRKIREN